MVVVLLCCCVDGAGHTTGTSCGANRGCATAQDFEKGDVDGLQHVAQERVRNSVAEQIGGVPVPHIWEPIVEVTRRERERKKTKREITTNAQTCDIKDDM